MIPINKNWNRWILASMASYLKTAVAPIKFLTEGHNQQTQQDMVELRMTGPTWTSMSPISWRGIIVFNALVRAIRDEQDFQKIYKLTGVAEAAFIICVPVFKYGTGTDDNPQIKIGELILQTHNNDNDIETLHFGQLAPDVPILESTVEAHYRIDFD